MTNNLDAQAATPRAITDPIFADLAPHLIIISHADGAAMTTAHQATVQNNMLAGVATNGANRVPSFLIIGPPVGYNSTTDAAFQAQQAVQQALADSRGDAFYDNRSWALPVASALANGYIVDADVHYTEKAVNNWVASMFNKIGLAQSAYTSKGLPPSIKLARSGTLRAYKTDYEINGNHHPEIVGALSIVNRAGESGSGYLRLESATGSTSNNDACTIDYNGNIRFKLLPSSADTMNLGYDYTVGYQWLQFGATAAAPAGSLGTSAKPWHSVYFGKTVTAAGTTGDRTGGNAINKATGSVNFASAATSLVVTNSLAIAPSSGSTGSIIMATVRTNDATMKSVAVVCSSSGSFTLHANAAPTGECRVDFAIITP
jgi:hypothetical protein